MINLKLDNSPISDVKYGSQHVDEVYHDSNLVWDRVEWDGEYVYFRMGRTLGCTPASGCTPYEGDILLGGSDGLLYDTGSSNPNYDGLIYINKYGFEIGTSAREQKAGYSLLNLFDGKNEYDAYACLTTGNASSRQIDINIHMPFNQWELRQVGYWEGAFSDPNAFVNMIFIIPPDVPLDNDNYVRLWSGEPFSSRFRSFPCSYSFTSGESSKNRFILALITATERFWHTYTEITFELKIPYTEYKAWKREYHVPVKIAEKTINNETIGTIVMKKKKV